MKKVDNIIESKRIHSFLFFLGEVSIDLLNSTVSWKPSTSLVSIVEKVTDIIDNPSTDLVQNIGLYNLFYTYLCINFFIYFCRSSSLL